MDVSIMFAFLNIFYYSAVIKHHIDLSAQLFCCVRLVQSKVCKGIRSFRIFERKIGEKLKQLVGKYVD